MSSDYVLSKPIKRKLESIGYKLSCVRCGRPIKIGDEVHSRLAQTTRNIRKFYHKRCWESLFFQGEPKL